MKDNSAAKADQPSVSAGIAKRSATVLFAFILQALILFGGAGRIDWLWAWVYLGIFLATVLTNGTIMLRRSPEMIAERGQPREVKRWDKIVSGIWGGTQYLALPMVAALDLRLAWTRDLSIAWHVAGAVITAFGFGLTAWAMIANVFFSTAVRIQSERGHTVCRTGPYRIVRHPGYVGMAFSSLGLPIMLGSLWALIPGIATVVTMTIRTMLEDRLLQAELPGYREYAERVRYRLVPGIW